MNSGVLVYRILELLVDAYVAFLFFRMGRNRVPKYMRIRENLAGRIPVFTRDGSHFVCAAVMVLLILIRIATVFSGT